MFRLFLFMSVFLLHTDVYAKLSTDSLKAICRNNSDWVTIAETQKGNSVYKVVEEVFENYFDDVVVFSVTYNIVVYSKGAAYLLDHSMTEYCAMYTDNGKFLDITDIQIFNSKIASNKKFRNIDKCYLFLTLNRNQYLGLLHPSKYDRKLFKKSAILRSGFLSYSFLLNSGGDVSELDSHKQYLRISTNETIYVPGWRYTEDSKMHVYVYKFAFNKAGLLASFKCIDNCQ